MRKKVYMEHECLKELKELRLFDYYAAHIMQGVISQKGIFHSELEITINQVFDAAEKMIMIRESRILRAKEKIIEEGNKQYIHQESSSKLQPKPIFSSE